MFKIQIKQPSLAMFFGVNQSHINWALHFSPVESQVIRKRRLASKNFLVNTCHRKSVHGNSKSGTKLARVSLCEEDQGFWVANKLRRRFLFAVDSLCFKFIRSKWNFGLTFNFRWRIRKLTQNHKFYEKENSSEMC